jgi:hypothetical protein
MGNINASVTFRMLETGFNVVKARFYFVVLIAILRNK